MEKVFVDNAETPTFQKFIMPHLKNNLDSIPIKSWGYAKIKKEVQEAEVGTRTVEYATSIPPKYVMALPLREQLMWEWRFREAVRIQQRLSFWVEISEWNEEDLRKIAFDMKIDFRKEVITQKEYNRRRNIYKKKRKYYEVEVNTELGGLQKFKVNISEMREDLLEKKLFLTSASGTYFDMTIVFPRGRKGMVFFALDMEHACQLLSLRLKRSSYVIRVQELENLPKKRTYEEWWDGRTVLPVEASKEGVEFEKLLAGESDTGLPGDTGVEETASEKISGSKKESATGTKKPGKQEVMDLI